MVKEQTNELRSTTRCLAFGVCGRLRRLRAFPRMIDGGEADAKGTRRTKKKHPLSGRNRSGKEMTAGVVQKVEEAVQKWTCRSFVREAKIHEQRFRQKRQEEGARGKKKAEHKHSNDDKPFFPWLPLEPVVKSIVFFR